MAIRQTRAGSSGRQMASSGSAGLTGTSSARRVSCSRPTSEPTSTRRKPSVTFRELMDAAFKLPGWRADNTRACPSPSSSVSLACSRCGPRPKASGCTGSQSRRSRACESRSTDGRTSRSRPGDDPLASVSGELFEIQAEVEPGDAAQVGLDIRGHRVTYDVKAGTLTVLGRTAALPPQSGRIKLQVLVDRTSVEVFGNDGRLSMSSCFLPAIREQEAGYFQRRRDRENRRP